MTVPARFAIDSPADAQRAAELRRVKLLATLVLAATFVIFIAARALLPIHPAFGFVAAFAEAATIGGLADWYAVVALFRRPAQAGLLFVGYVLSFRTTRSGDPESRDSGFVLRTPRNDGSGHIAI